MPKDISQEISMLEVPFYIEAGGESCRDGQLSLKDLTVLTKSGKGDYPSTAAPNPYDFDQAYKFSSKFDGILVVTLSDKSSSSYVNADLAVKVFRKQPGSEIPIEVVDSRGGTMTQGFLIMKADELIKAGKSLEEIAETLRVHATGDNLVFTCRETTYLYRSGRLGRAKHVMASVLRFRPLVGLSDGELGEIGRARSQKKAYTMVAEEVLSRSSGQIQKLAIIGGLDTKEGEASVLEQIRAGLKAEPEQIVRTTICPAMGVHAGPHFVGVAWM